MHEKIVKATGALKYLGALILMCFVSIPVSAKYSAGGYITYTYSDAVKKWLLPDTEEGGLSITSVQGMAIGKKYCYVAKHKDNAYADVRRINMDTGSAVWMKYCSKIGATSESDLSVMGHANELEIVEEVGEKKETWLFCPTANTSKAIVRMKVSNDTLFLAGYYNVTSEATTSKHVSALKYVKTVGNDMYFIIKNGRSFYLTTIPVDNLGGTASSPVLLTTHKMFSIDVASTIFATSNSNYSTLSGLSDWENQGFGYNHNQKVIYVPLWKSTTGSQNNSAIITYNVADYIIDENWTNPKNYSDVLYPTRTQFKIVDSSGKTFEIETASFRPGDDNTLYFNTNSYYSDKEAVYAITLTETDFTPINKTTSYTVKFNGNGGAGSMSDIVYTQGSGTAISSNTFTHAGYSFGGWYAHRASDDSWLYKLESGSEDWYQKGEQPVGAVLSTKADGCALTGMTETDGDTITLYAYWLPNTTGTKMFYVRYDGNGGEGSMDETAVTYGTSTKTRSNTFVREGYAFVGWTAYRHNKSQWGYKNNSTFGDKWLGGSDDKSGYIFKTYANEGGVASTTSVDADIVTFYANWARVEDGAIPQNVEVGTDFEIGGKLACTTDLYGFVVNIKNNAGEVVQTYSAETYSSRTTADGGVDLSQANGTLDFSTLAEGGYTFEVVAQVVAGSTPHSTTVHTSTFEVGAESPETPEPPSGNDPVFNDNITSLTEEWNYSQNSGNTAGWITNGSQVTQDMAFNDGKLYVVHRNGDNTDNKIYIVDAYTGSKIGELNTVSCTSGTYALSSIEVLGDKVVAANLAASDASELVVYSWDSDSAEPKVLLSTTDHNNVRAGDAMSVSGDMTSGRIWFATPGASSVYYYSVTNGECSTSPTVINLTKDGVAYTAHSSAAANITVESDGTFWVDAQNLKAAHFTATGEFIEEIAAAHEYGTDYKSFALGAKKYAAVMTYANKTNTLTEASFQLLDVTDGVSAATVIGTYPTAGLGPERNKSYRNSLCYEIGEEKLYIWVLVPFQGAACYSFQRVVSSGVETLLSVPEENAPVEWYNFQGVRVDCDNLTPGIYIRRQGSNVGKVYVR